MHWVWEFKEKFKNNYRSEKQILVIHKTIKFVDLTTLGLLMKSNNEI